MLSKVEIKNKALELRRRGHSYREIMAIIPVSKSTLSGWISQIELTPQQQETLREKMSEGRGRSRYASMLAHKKKRLAREAAVVDIAKEEFKKNKLDDLFFIGITLYWAEGGKKSKYFQFVNSDPEMIMLIIKWIEKFLKISRENIKYRLYIHQPYANEKCEEFWSSKIGVNKSLFYKTIYKPTSHNVKKNPDYKGCFALTITKIDIFYTLMTWQKLLIAYYREVKP